MNKGQVRVWGGAHGFGITRDEDGAFPLFRYDSTNGDAASIDVGDGHGNVRLWFDTPADLDDFIDAVAALRTPPPRIEIDGRLLPKILVDKEIADDLQRKLDQIGEIVND